MSSAVREYYRVVFDRPEDSNSFLDEASRSDFGARFRELGRRVCLVPLDPDRIWTEAYASAAALRAVRAQGVPIIADQADPIDIADLPHGLSLVLGNAQDSEAYDATRRPRRAD